MITKFESFIQDDEEELSEYQIRNAKERIANQFWIDRSGKEYYWQGSIKDAWNLTSLHVEIAYELFPDLKDAEDYLMNLGWILVGSTVYNWPIIHKKPSQAQINKLYDLGLYKRLLILYNNTYPKYDDVKNNYEDYD